MWELIRGVDAARAETNRNVYLSSPSGSRTVEFDVAVTVENKDAAAGKAGVRVLNFAEAGGDIRSETTNSTVSRIKFGLNIDALTKEEVVERERELKNSENLSARAGYYI